MAGSFADRSGSLVHLDSVDDQTTLDAILGRLGLQHLSSTMRAQDMDIHLLVSATDEELSALGVGTIGKRRRLRTALNSALGLDEKERERDISPEGNRKSVAFSQAGWSRTDNFSFKRGSQRASQREWRGSAFLPGMRQSMRSVRSENLTPVERREFNNTLGFGFQPWAAAEEAPMEEQTPEMQHLLTSPETTYKYHDDTPSVVGNIAYTVLIGWWVALVYAAVGCLQVLTVVNWEYGVWCLHIARYMLTPFGRYVCTWVSEEPAEGPTPNNKNPLPPTERTPLATTPPGSMCSEPHPRCGAISLWLFRICFMPLLAAVHAALWCATWMLVFTIPTARLHKQMLELLISHSPTKAKPAIGIPDDTTRGVLICYLAPFSTRYWKYSVYGVNIIMLNLCAFVPVNFAFKFAFPTEWVDDNSILVMVCGIFAIVPLSYYIGHSVAAVSAQTSFFVGAVLNATFGSIIELMIYFISLSKGLNELVVSATTGALLACMLLLPGLSMLLGGLKFKEQRFNRKAGSTSALMLLVAISGLFLPSIYYNIYRREKIGCAECEMYQTLLSSDSTFTGSFQCETCNYTAHEYDKDSVYTEHMEPLMYTVAVLLLLCYVVGLVFTLHTHAFIYEEEEDAGAELTETVLAPRCTAAGESDGYSARDSMATDPFKTYESEEHGHGPGWSTRTCVFIMVTGTLCFAVCSETLVDALKPSLDKMGISENFAGLTLVAVIPCIAEFVNAIQFAMQDNIKLSLEIGNIAAIQMILVQMPILTFGSIMMGKYYPDDGFVLLFPRLNLTCVFLAAAILIYCLLDGTSNYFQGVAMLVVYLIMVLCFYHVPSDHADYGFA